MKSSWTEWCARFRVSTVVVVSPHLDDGVFSAYSALVPGHVQRRVLATVFSDAPPDDQSDWARVTGFPTNRQEFEARRTEDQDAAEALGISALHLNEYTSTWAPDRAQSVLDRLVRSSLSTPGSTLMLLPAGAGRMLSPIQRLGCRLIRRPLGPPDHGEHLMARDLLKVPLLGAGFRLGYYAELPYVWSDRVTELSRRLEHFHGDALTTLRVEPDIDAKLAVARLYRSQWIPILGTDTRYQRRVFSHPEIFFLPR